MWGGVEGVGGRVFCWKIFKYCISIIINNFMYSKRKKGGGGGERQTERQRQREAETDRQTDRQRENVCVLGE